MSSTVISTFKFKRATEERWEEVNPILEQGEPGFVYDKNKLKIGDGINSWKDLQYINFPIEDGKTIEITKEGMISLFGAKTADKNSFLTLNETGEIFWKSLEEIDNEKNNIIYEFSPKKNEKEEIFGFEIRLKKNGVIFGEPIIFNFDVYTKTETDFLFSKTETRIDNMLTGINANTNAIKTINNETSGLLVQAKQYTDEKIASLSGSVPIAGILPGLVRSSNNKNQVMVETDGTMTVNSISTDKLFVPEDSELILNGGTIF